MLTVLCLLFLCCFCSLALIDYFVCLRKIFNNRLIASEAISALDDQREEMRSSTIIDYIELHIHKSQ